jgi:hypothetical protein
MELYGKDGGFTAVIGNLFHYSAVMTMINIMQIFAIFQAN